MDSSEYPAASGNGADVPDSDPDPVNRWDIKAMEELLETVVSKQITAEARFEELEIQFLTLRKIVENSINVQLQDKQATHTKLDLLLSAVLKTFPIVG